MESNDIDYMHSEQMADFGGTVTLHHDSDGAWRVTNGTTHPLEDCRAVRGGKPGGIDRRIGRLEPGATRALVFEPYSRRETPAAERSKDGLGDPSDRRSQGSDPSGELSVKAIADVALDRQELRDGEICLVAQVAGEVPGLTVTPVAQQTRQAALLVAHLNAAWQPARSGFPGKARAAARPKGESQSAGRSPAGRGSFFASG